MQFDLNEKTTVWYYMVKNQLIPTSHNSFIKRTRVMMVYCLMKGIEFNFGQLIRDQIRVCSEKTRDPFFFPSPITKLCLRVGVEVNEEDVVTPKKSATSMRRVWRYSIVREEDSPPTASVLETREVVTREQYDELV